METVPEFGETRLALGLPSSRVGSEIRNKQGEKTKSPLMSNNAHHAIQLDCGNILNIHGYPHILSANCGYSMYICHLISIILWM